MKKLLLIFSLSLYSLIIQAQSWVYHPFPTDSAIWTNTKGTWQFPPGWPTTSWPPPYVEYDAPDRYCMSSADTVIGTVNYSQLYRCGSSYYGALRDDGIGKIYFIPADSINELLIYDFTLQNGDTAKTYINLGSGFMLNDNPNAFVDSTLINGSYRKRIRFSGTANYWIEGIGCTQGLFREVWPNVSNWYTNLECMSEGNTSIYPVTASGPCSLTSGVDEITAGSQPEIFPNPSSGEFTILWRGQKHFTAVVYDVLGNIVHKGSENEMQIDLSAQTPGIYFIRLTNNSGNVITKKIITQ